MTAPLHLLATSSRNDTVWLERMYNNRALVTDHMDYFTRWAIESAKVRAHWPCVLDMPYGSGVGETLDIFPPVDKPAAPVPVMVFIHGGYWRSLDKSDHSFVALPFTQAGFCVVVVNYALCPGTPDMPVTVPHIVQQVEKALGWVVQNIAAHGGDVQRITVVGHSAGGQLAAMLLTGLRPLMESELHQGFARNALSISGVHDLEPLMHIATLQSTLRLTLDQVVAVSPARLPPPRSGQLCCVVGADESSEFIRQNHLMQQAWGNQVVPHSKVLPGLHHFSVVDALAAPGHAVHQMALSLLQA